MTPSRKSTTWVLCGELLCPPPAPPWTQALAHECAINLPRAGNRGVQRTTPAPTPHASRCTKGMGPPACLPLYTPPPRESWCYSPTVGVLKTHLWVRGSNSLAQDAWFSTARGMMPLLPPCGYMGL